jgi:hypothetical protein
MNTKLQNSIMRRVYYAYALRLIMSRTGAYFIGFASTALILVQMVSVPAIMHNMLSVPVGEVHRFFLGAFLNTEAWTLLAFFVCVALLAAIVREVQRADTHTQHFRLG